MMGDPPTVSVAEGCYMCDSLYVKANGEFPCWSGTGESLALQTLNEQELVAGEDQPLFHAPAMLAIRSAFLEGRTPHHDYCATCAVRGASLVESMQPKKMRVLHVEPAYLCQLSCAECVLPKVRLKIKGPPYYMNFSYFEALLRRLLKEGVESIGLVKFEGRGEPLLNQRLGDMIRLTRRHFPDSFIQVVTHGNFPYKPWMVDSGLDLLTVSVDGAYPESYVKYRVGGELEKPLALMRALRDEKVKTGQILRVRWKYILFEWNDSDEEICEANRLAEELNAELRFILTHTPGKSLRFRNMAELGETLARILPNSAVTQATIDRVPHLIGYPYPSTTNQLADLSVDRRDYTEAERLYRKYLQLDPNGENRANVEIRLLVLSIGNRLGCSRLLFWLWSKRSAKFFLHLGLRPLLRSSIGWGFRVFRSLSRLRFRGGAPSPVSSAASDVSS